MAYALEQQGLQELAVTYYALALGATAAEIWIPHDLARTLVSLKRVPEARDLYGWTVSRAQKTGNWACIYECARALTTIHVNTNRDRARSLDELAESAWRHWRGPNGGAYPLPIWAWTLSEAPVPWIIPLSLKLRTPENIECPRDRVFPRRGSFNQVSTAITFTPSHTSPEKASLCKSMYTAGSESTPE